jgi:hypothetical protein
MTVFKKVGTPVNKNDIPANEVGTAVTENGIIF